MPTNFLSYCRSIFTQNLIKGVLSTDTVRAFRNACIDGLYFLDDKQINYNDKKIAFLGETEEALRDFLAKNVFNKIEDEEKKQKAVESLICVFHQPCIYNPAEFITHYYLEQQLTSQQEPSQEKPPKQYSIVTKKPRVDITATKSGCIIKQTIAIQKLTLYDKNALIESPLSAPLMTVSVTIKLDVEHENAKEFYTVLEASIDYLSSEFADFINPQQILIKKLKTNVEEYTIHLRNSAPENKKLRDDKLIIMSEIWKILSDENTTSTEKFKKTDKLLNQTTKNNQSYRDILTSKQNDSLLRTILDILSFGMLSKLRTGSFGLWKSHGNEFVKEYDKIIDKTYLLPSSKSMK